MKNSQPASGVPLRVPTIRGLKNKKKLTALTAYDFTMASLLDRAGIDIILVGDSLSCVIQGNETTLPATLDEMIYHCKAVTKGVKRALVVGDLPFLSYQPSIEKAIESAGRLLKEGNVSAVKLEGGEQVAEIIARLTAFDIPVMGHVGLTPQSFHRMGGHRLQGKASANGRPVPGSREQIIEDAQAVAEAGAFAVVLEGIPAELAADITAQLEIPTIGIAAGPDCDGQILVCNDLLGFSAGSIPKFVKPYADLNQIITQAVQEFCNEVEGEISAGSAGFQPARYMKSVMKSH